MIRRVRSAKVTSVSGSPGRGRYRRRRSRSVAPSGKTRSNVRNMPANAERSPCARKSWNCAERVDMWFTMRSAMTSTARLRRDVVPRPQPRVDLGVIRRVEPGVGPVDRCVERQQVHTAEQARERALEQVGETADRPAQPIRVGDELHLVPHGTLGARDVRSRLDQGPAPSAAPESNGPCAGVSRRSGPLLASPARCSGRCRHGRRRQAGLPARWRPKTSSPTASHTTRATPVIASTQPGPSWAISGTDAAVNRPPPTTGSNMSCL